MVKNKDTPKPRDYRYHSNQIKNLSKTLKYPQTFLKTLKYPQNPQTLQNPLTLLPQNPQKLSKTLNLFVWGFDVSLFFTIAKISMLETLKALVP